MVNKTDYEDVGTVIKGMNYTLPTFKLEDDKVVRGLNTTLKFFNQTEDGTLKQQGIDPRTLIVVLTTYLFDLEMSDNDLEDAVILLAELRANLENKIVTKSKSNE